MLIQENDTVGALTVLRTLLAKQQKERYERCVKLLAPSICRNNNPNPFYLWAQVAANGINGSPLNAIKTKLMNQLQLI